MDTVIDPRPSAAGPDETTATALPGADAFELARALVRENTRFEPAELSQTAGAEVRQPMTLTVEYTLSARLHHCYVNGHTFAAQADDVRAAAVHSVPDDARRDADERLALAHATLHGQLASPATAHNAVSSGVYLGYQRRHWHLHQCVTCVGYGQVACYTCDGHRQEACDCCGGDGRVVCYLCQGSGRSYCVRCNDTGRVVETEFKGHQRSFACGCGGGGLCKACAASGTNPCKGCNATGRIRCRTCEGGGRLVCDPCDGSGQCGEAAWIEVDVAQRAAMALPDDAGADARAIAAMAGSDGAGADPSAIAVKPALQLAAAADIIEHAGAVVLDGARVRATYALLVRVVNLDVASQSRSYRLVAYGRPLAWLALDDIVEDLLRYDLHTLQQALEQGAQGAALLEPLRALAASEMNIEVIESLVDGRSRAHLQTVSEEYGRELRAAFLGALQRVYDQQGNRSWWHGMLGAGAATLGVWSQSTLGWAVLAGLLATYLCLRLFRRRMRGHLTMVLGGERLARRTMALAVRDGRQRRATRLVVLPALAVVCALTWQLPWDGWRFTHGGKARAEGSFRAG